MPKFALEGGQSRKTKGAVVDVDVPHVSDVFPEIFHVSQVLLICFMYVSLVRKS